MHLENPYLESIVREIPQFLAAQSSDLLADGLLLGQVEKVYGLRQALTRRYAWAIPDEDAIRAIAAWSPIVEIGAGTGYWASLLSQAGADVVAYDPEPGHSKWCDAQLYFPVQVGDASKAAAHPGRTLLLCWPPYRQKVAQQALEAYQGHRLVYIGEPEGGCCASDGFFALLHRSWELVREQRIPQWPGIYDRVFFYERRKEAIG